MNLIIVESPAKGKTIEKFLGKNFRVIASFGHIKDLPKKHLGVDINDGFKPHYFPVGRSRQVVAALKKEAGKAEVLYFGTDFDREGEAIAYHIFNTLKPVLNKKTKVGRITFTEITKEALLKAINSPREIDMNLVYSQQARRVLDRLVGYKLSPFLWRKVASGLSAGRVQSAALRMITEREREIESFKPQEYWTIIATTEKKKQKKGEGQFKSVLIALDDKPLGRLAIKTESEAKSLLNALSKASYRVVLVRKTKQRKTPPPPFITSTLQQEAFLKLGFSAKKTMTLAQALYEAGFITYHRTDSTHLAQSAPSMIRRYIQDNFGKKYLPENARQYKTKVLKAQEAHEAIRPTDIGNLPLEGADSKISDDHKKLYRLIWQRAVASQMEDAVLDSESVDIEAQTREKENLAFPLAKKYTFRATGQSISFDGFIKVYPLSIQESYLPPLSAGEELKLVKLDKEKHLTKPPSRYTEASLIKQLEKEGIGRPSTYASIISTLQERGYVHKAKQQLFPSEIGFLVSDLLVKHFPDIVDLGFTAKMEKELDEVAEGKKQYQTVCEDFWGPFSKTLSEKDKELKKSEIVAEETDQKCELCGGKMVVRFGRFGKFLSCANFPKCKNKKPFLKLIGIKCPKCNEGEVVERVNKRGRIFYGCSRYPECNWADNHKPSLSNNKE